MNSIIGMLFVTQFLSFPCVEGDSSSTSLGRLLALNWCCIFSSFICVSVSSLASQKVC